MADFDPVSYMMGQQAGGGGGGGGSSTLAGLTDVDISNPTDGQTLVYDATSGKWENGESAGGGSLLVTLTMTENQQKKENAKAGPVTTYTLAADKTAGEILTAIKAGKCVIYTFTDSVSELEYAGYLGPVVHDRGTFFVNLGIGGPVEGLIADTADDYPSYDEYEP